MIPINAVYIRMNGLLEEMGNVAAGMNREIISLRDRLSFLGISWLGTAYEAYSRRMFDDLDVMEHTAEGIVVMCGLLYASLAGYQDTESRIADVIGGMKR